MSSEITAAVFALAGTALGSLTTMAVQWRVGVLEQRKLVHEARGRVNALGITVFRGLLTTGKVVERLAELRRTGHPPSEDDIRSATDRMWLAWQEVSVFSPTAMREPSLTFVRALQHAVWHETDVPLSEFLNGPRGALFDVAGPIFREQDTLGDAYANPTA